MPRAERALCLLMALLLTGFCADAEEAATAEAAALEAQAAAEPVAEPVVEPAAEPAAEPVAEPVPEPVAEQPAEPAAEPAAEPVAEPVPEPVAEQPAEPAAEPAVEPVAEPVPEPVAEQPAEPVEETAQGLLIRVSDPGDLNPVNGLYTVDVNRYASLTLAWACGAALDGYAVALVNERGEAVYYAVQRDPSLYMLLSAFEAGRYTLYVVAQLEGNPVAQAELYMELTQGQAGGDMPGGDTSGGKSGGSRSGRSAGSQGGQANQAAQGFQVTAGKALTSSHEVGSKDMRLYGSVELMPPEEAMTRLLLGGEALEIELDEGASAFTARVEKDMLVLVPQDLGDEWTVNGYALRTLQRSGVETVLLTLDGGTQALPTRSEWNGAVYGRLCAAGYVSSDYEYRVSADAVRVSVDGKTYRLNERGELEAEEP